MRNTTATLLMGSLAASVLFGQSPRTPPTPAALAQRRVDMHTQRLGLNASQQQEALAIYTKSATANAGMQAGLRTAHDGLRTAIQTGATGNINNLATQIGNLTAESTVNDAMAEAEFYKILTPGQQATYSQPGHRGFGRRPGQGPGGPPPAIQ